MSSYDDVTQHHSRLIEVIQEERAALGSYSDLASEIARLSGTDLRPIDRRKLKRIADGDVSVSLSFLELSMIDRWLTRTRGLGVGSFFATPTIMKQIANSRELNLLVGCHPARTDDDRQISVTSRWDLHAVTESLLPALHRDSHGRGVVVHMHDVLTDPDREVNEENYEREFRGERWLDLMKDDSTCITIASQRANAATEVLLSRMFGIAPFKDHRVAHAAGVPFRLLWSESFLNHMRSSFAEPFETSAERDRPSVGISFKGERFFVRQNSDKWKSWGILVGQARGTNAILFACIGATGPATLACAEIFTSQTPPLPGPRGDTAAPVVYALVEVLVERREGRRGDDREIVDRQIVGDFETWYPHNSVG